ncbi:MAG: hypothetical protein F6K42_34355 [Leptolyngbya sp. SIO1D8]|nr:hypothetical protein [Leptolyngbya sp. SIO1D8]
MDKHHFLRPSVCLLSVFFLGSACVLACECASWAEFGAMETTDDSKFGVFTAHLTVTDASEMFGTERCQEDCYARSQQLLGRYDLETEALTILYKRHS